jgi:hypothetical protein
MGSWKPLPLKTQVRGITLLVLLQWSPLLYVTSSSSDRILLTQSINSVECALQMHLSSGYVEEMESFNTEFTGPQTETFMDYISKDLAKRPRVGFLEGLLLYHRGSLRKLLLQWGPLGLRSMFLSPLQILPRHLPRIYISAMILT